jgi:uncharacterized protein with ATP-grasp and redox domains
VTLWNPTAGQTTVPFQFNCVSALQGNLRVTVVDEFTYYAPGAPKVTNATVTLIDPYAGTNITSAVTGADGVALFTNLPEAYYGVRVQAAGAALKAVDDNFSTDGLTLDIATKIHRVVKDITGNPDPYRRMKDEEIKLSKGIIAELAPSYPQDIKGLMALSVLGNSIDFFRRQDDVAKDLRRTVKFYTDHSDRFIEKLKKAKNILFLGDNAGEIFFDLPLVRCLEQYAPAELIAGEMAPREVVEAIRAQMVLAAQQAFNLSLFAVIPTRATAPDLLAKAVREARNLAVEADILEKDTIALLLGKAQRESVALEHIAGKK